MPRPARARRAQPAHRDGGRGARPGRRGDLRRRLLVGGPEVHGDAADPRPGGRLRVVSRRAPRRGSRPAASATRRIPRRRSAPSSTRARWRTCSPRSSAARSEGGSVLAGGERDGEGYLVTPTVFEGVADDAYLSCEEVFGPVTSLYRYGTLDEAIERANAVPFGLSASIYTRDLHAVQRFSEELQAGILHVNSQTAGADVHVPFGGIKGSGFGPHEQGRAALEFFTETVTVYQDAPLACRVPRALPRHRRPRLPRRLGRAGCARRRRGRRRLRPRRRPRRASSSCSATTPTRSTSSAATSPTSSSRAHPRRARQITRVVHLAALQVPFVRANPPLGMHVNVAGTVNVFEAVAKRLDRIPGVATRARRRSTARSDPSPAPESGGTAPGTLYGVSKLADEGMARVYASGRRAAVDRPAPLRRLRPGARPGHDGRPDRGDAGGGTGRAVRHRLHRRARSTTTRPTSAARS